MREFLFGVVVGAAGAMWYTQTKGEIDVDQRFLVMQERANAVLNESRRILEETRQELGAAIESGKRLVVHDAERIRQAAETTTIDREPEAPADERPQPTTRAAERKAPGAGETQSPPAS